MKRTLLFCLTILVFVFPVERTYAKLDILREVDNLVEGGRPNVLIVIDHTASMTGLYTATSGGGHPEHNDTDVNSRFFQMKDVMRGLDDGTSGGSVKPTDSVLNATKGMVNYGMMTFEQFNYWPYYTADCQTNAANCDGADPQLIMSPALNDSFPGTSFVYNSTVHNGTDFGGGGHPVNGTTYYHFNYANTVKIKDDPILFSGGSIGSDEGTFRGGMIVSDLNPHLDPLNNITAIQDLFKLENQGGIVVTGNNAAVQKMFRGATSPAEDVENYFTNHVFPSDTGNPAACFTKNYVILISSGTNNAANWNTVRKNADTLRDGISWGGNTYPIKTFVIGLIDIDTVGGGLRSSLNDVARYGGTDANDPNGFYGLNESADTNFGADFNITSDDVGSCSGTEVPNPQTGCNDYAFFVKNAAQLQTAFSKIIAVISGGDFVTGAPSATSSGGSFIMDDLGILASTEYPEWRGHLRAVDLVNDHFWWDAGANLFISAADANLPKAIVNSDAAYVDASPWRDTDGDGTTDQPPLRLTVGTKTYQYTGRVIYCKNANYPNNCVSTALASNEFVGTTVKFKDNSTDPPTDVTYTYKGAFYVAPWGDRKVYTSQKNGDTLSFTTANAVTINTLAGWGVSTNYAKAIINFALGGIDADKDGTVDTGVDANKDGVIDLNDAAENIEVAREWWLGDITNVVPVGVGKPIDPKDGLAGRSTFRETYAARDTIIYTGSNDMMLHAYNFATGNELFAYIPPDLLTNLKTLFDNAIVSANPAGFSGQPIKPEDHIYGIATSFKVNDVKFADGTWHTVLTGGEGPGNKHYFALDVTDPTQTFGTSLYTLLWHTIEDGTASIDLASSYSSKLGESWSVPAFGRIKDSGTFKWVVFAGSGYDDTVYTDNKGRTYNVINVEDGSLLNDILTDAPTGNKVQFSLLADSVSIIKKSGSRVYTSYQADLAGRIWSFNTTSSTISDWDSTKTSLAKTTGSSDTQFNPSPSKPFYYSPAVWDFDNETTTAKNLMIIGSGAYDDPEMEAVNNADLVSDLTSTFYFLITTPATSAITDAITVDVANVTGTAVDSDGNTITAPDLTGARMVASPVLFNNRTSGSLEALFLVFIPPTAAQLGCSFGNSYLLVFDLGSPDTFTGTTASDSFDVSAGSPMEDVKANKAKFIVSMGSGKVSGIGIAGGGSHVVVGQSGYGGGDTSGFTLSGGSSWNPIGDASKLFWKETD